MTRKELKMNELIPFLRKTVSTLLPQRLGGESLELRLPKCERSYVANLRNAQEKLVAACWPHEISLWLYRNDNNSRDLSVHFYLNQMIKHENGRVSRGRSEWYGELSPEGLDKSEYRTSESGADEILEYVYLNLKDGSEVRLSTD